MDAIHTFSLPLHANPARLDPCVSRDWIAIPLTKTVIGLWRVENLTDAKPLPFELAGHSKEINSLAFSGLSAKYLASACADKILIWDLQHEKDNQICNTTLHLKPGLVSAMCFNNNDDLIAASVDRDILLLKSRKANPLAVLEVHQAMITGLAFCPHYSATLLSISDDRSYCVWDINAMVLIYQSTIISSAPLISLSMSLTSPQVAIGTADGGLKIYDLTDGNSFRQLAAIDIASCLRKKFEAIKANEKPASGPLIVTKRGKQIRSDMINDESPTVIQSSESVLSIQYAYFTKEASDSSNAPSFMQMKSGAGDVLDEKPPSITIITSNALLQINSKTFEILDVINLQIPINSNTFNASRTVGSIAYSGLGQIGPSQMLAVVGAMFDRKIDVVQWTLVDTGTKVSSDAFSPNEFSDTVGDDLMSLIPNSALLATSPLRSELFPPVASDTVTKGDIATGKKKSPGMMNQPLTFKSKVKSSGYTQAPRKTMFKPETSRKKLLNLEDQTKVKTEKPKVSLSKMLKADYDTHKGPPVDHCDTFQVDHRATAVFSLKFADDGNGLGCALSNKCGLILKSPYSKHVSTPLIGHDNAVNSVFWSSDNAYLLTASSDKTVSVWDKAGGDPVMTLIHQKGTLRENQPSKEPSLSLSSKTSSSVSSRKTSTSNFSSDKSASTVCNKPFSKDIKHAQFFYMDKFILLIHGPELHLYSYYITPEKDEIKRYHSRNRYKLVSSWQTQSSSFTAMKAVNTFFSHFVMCTTSGRNLEVYDLNRDVLAHSFSDCHSRPPYCVTLNEGSCFASQPSEAHNIIATVALTDPIKLWDLRSKTNVQALQGHLNNAHACQIAFSPCGNYLAAGSEDKTVYIYDLRKSTYCERLRGHNEVVTSVAFHPAHPLLASGSLNSKILFFKSK